MWDSIVADSSIWRTPSHYSEYNSTDNAIRVGIVRREAITKDGDTRYVVDVYEGGNQIPVSCVMMTRFGGVYNYEEYRPKQWARDVQDGLLGPGSSGPYTMRDGDVVLIAYLDGNAREGVILGSLRHPSREEKTAPKEISYISEFNGLEKKIDTAGAYTVTFKGTPAADLAKHVPGVAELPPPIYNEIKAGSTYGFLEDGSWYADASTPAADNSIQITRSATSPTITITSGANLIEITGNPAVGEINIDTGTLNYSALSTNMSSTKDFKVETLQMSLKGTQVAMGSDVFEIFQGLSDLIDAMGSLVVTSPVGTCTPLQAAPTWAAKVIPLQLKLKAVTGSL